MISGLYNKQVTFYSIVSTVDAYAAVSEALVLYSGPHKCYNTYIGGSKQVFAGKLNVIASHRLFMDVQSFLSTNMRCWVAEDELWYNLLYIDKVYKGNHLELLLEAITEPQVVVSDNYIGSSSSSMDSSSSSSSGD